MTEEQKKHTADERERVKSIFTFLKGMAELKTTSVLDIEKQPWKKYLAQLPQDDEYVHIYYRDTLKDMAEDDEVADDRILTVRKPMLSACPAPDDILRPWLLPGWEKFEEDVRHRAERLRPVPPAKGTRVAAHAETQEAFEENAERVQAYHAWSKRREVWAKEQRHLSEVRELFIEMYRLSEELKRDSETKELMIGNGVLTDAQNPNIQHPILLKRVRIRFDKQKNEIAVCDAESDSELYTTVLSELEDVNYNTVADMQRTLEQGGYHPLDRTDGCDFLKVAVHQLSPASLFLEAGQQPPPNSKERLFLQVKPVLFMRRRVDGLAKFVDGVLDNIDATGYVPQTLWAISGLHEKRTLEERPAKTAEQRLAELGGEDSEILLAMPANREQLAIAQQIERYDSVIVQGPPGTGKTHTIANLMGHFLAQGKRVLVTSHTKKALSVLREKMPPKLQSLCVSLLDETNRDMERSVGDISAYMSRYNSGNMQRRKEESLAARREIIQKLADVRQRIYQIECREHESLVYDGESLSPAEAARYVHAHEASYAAILPGKVAAGKTLPLSLEELYALYRSNGLLSAAEEHELALDVPDPKTLISPEKLAELRAEKEERARRLHDLAGQLDMKIEMDAAALCLTHSQRTVTLSRAEESATSALQQYLSSFGSLAPWHIHAVADGKSGGGYRDRWERLCKQIEETAAAAEEFVGVSFGKQVIISDDADRAEMQRVLPTMEEIYRQDGKIGRFKRFFDKSFDRVEGWTRINGAQIASAADCALACSALSLAEQRAACARMG
ncbi:hypothetical protein TAMA11512_05550 [Selenomonas sp. TAMA-11512]|uniref:AAA domain-containing protein n=1 Tax=Selenomonas sp. TAMA-11512 TaxID=3095337 RepID=UPI0030886DB8|nr:hypothetical protein TAMA11512_05550 [Selenomonas sp. TAMA-11512]